MNAAIIGTGVICEQHAQGLRGVDDARLVGVCDLSPAAAAYAAERFGADQAYTDHREMLAAAEPEVVHVLTPPHTHAAIVADCLDAGAHVLVEKPAAPTREAFVEMVKRSHAADRRVVEDHNYRFNQTVQDMVAAVDAGDVGAVREVEARMTLNIRAGGRYADANLPHPSHRLPAGVIGEFLSHLCYLTLLFVPEGVLEEEERFDRVAAAWSNHGPRPDDSSPPAPDTDPFRYDDLDATAIVGPVHLKLRFTAHHGPDAFTLTVRGTRGWASTDLFQPHVSLNTPRGGKLFSPMINQAIAGLELASAAPRNFHRKVLQWTPYEGLHRWVRLTYQALRDRSEPPVTLLDMDRTSRLAHAVLGEACRF